jgi:hypothetical protein
MFQINPLKGAAEIYQVWQNDRRSSAAERGQKTILRQMLRDKKWDWRHFPRLRDAISANDATAERLLKETGRQEPAAIRPKAQIYGDSIRY